MQKYKQLFKYTEKVRGEPILAHGYLPLKISKYKSSLMINANCRTKYKEGSIGNEITPLAQYQSSASPPYRQHVCELAVHPRQALQNKQRPPLHF